MEWRYEICHGEHKQGQKGILNRGCTRTQAELKAIQTMAGFVEGNFRERQVAFYTKLSTVRDALNSVWCQSAVQEGAMRALQDLGESTAVTVQCCKNVMMMQPECQPNRGIRIPVPQKHFRKRIRNWTTKKWNQRWRNTTIYSCLLYTSPSPRDRG